MIFSCVDKCWEILLMIAESKAPKRTYYARRGSKRSAWSNAHLHTTGKYDRLFASRTGDRMTFETEGIPKKECNTTNAPSRKHVHRECSSHSPMTAICFMFISTLWRNICASVAEVRGIISSLSAVLFHERTGRGKSWQQLIFPCLLSPFLRCNTRQ